LDVDRLRRTPNFSRRKTGAAYLDVSDEERQYDTT